jgi:hypothetical protein
MRYGIGREGFIWNGRERISKMSQWPGLASAQGDDRRPASYARHDFTTY